MFKVTLGVVAALLTLTLSGCSNQSSTSSLKDADVEYDLQADREAPAQSCTTEARALGLAAEDCASEEDFAATAWCRYGPGVFGGVQFKARYETREACRGARTVNDYCAPCN